LCGTVYWLFGFTLAFGEGSSFAGLYPYVAGYKLQEKKMFAKWFFELSYASTPSTIVSGAVAERCSFIGYLIYSSTISCKILLYNFVMSHLKNLIIKSLILIA